MAEQAKRKPGRPPGSKNKKKKTSSKPKSNSATDRVKTDKRLRDEIWAITCMAIGAFIFAAVQFKAAGQFGEALGDGLKGIFGLVALILPWYLIGFGILLFLHKTVHLTGKSGALVFNILLMICLLNSERFIDPNNLTLTVSSIGKFYETGVTLTSGGAFGMVIATILIKLIGVAGLNIFAVVSIIISLLLVINTPISKGLESLRVKREERRIVKEERRAEEQKLEALEAPKEKTPSKKMFKLGEKSNILKYMSDENLFDRTEETKSNVSFGLEEKQDYGKGFGIEEIKENLNKEDVPCKPISTTTYNETYQESFFESKDTVEDSPAKITNKEASLASLDESELNLTKKSLKYHKPSIDLLNKPVDKGQNATNGNLQLKAQKLEQTLQNFKVDARVVQVTQGPAITRYEIQPNIGVKVNSIVRLADDIALNLEAKSIRIEAPIPGKAAVGIEVENDSINMVTLREIIGSKEFKNAKSKITFAVGKDIAGKAIVADLKSMPHLLIAGSTGSGKSVCINSIITSILYKANPDEVKLVLIDPKVVELGNYNGIPHLLIPVVTEPSKAAAALNWAVAEMTDRYKKFADQGVRDLESYNEYVIANDEADLVMPQVVIIIDELADLMMAAPSQVEESICRLAQMARAAGMHLIVATQRPSVDIITGVIKANIPSRIAFAVSSQFDSRTILDMAGAEKLVGKGDMLFNPLGMGKPIRVQGTFISDGEVHKVIEHVKSQIEEVEYASDVLNTMEKTASPTKGEDTDDLLPEAIECVVNSGQASISMLQRRFRIGYNRGARIVDMMEARGIIGPQDGSRPRQVLISEDELEQLKKETEDI